MQWHYKVEYLLNVQFQIDVNRIQLNQKHHVKQQMPKDHQFDTNV